MATPQSAEDWNSVETLDDLAAYLKLLGVDFEASKPDTEGERWAHATTGAFLEAFGAWLNDGYLAPGAPWADARPVPSWREFARMLWAARSYE